MTSSSPAAVLPATPVLERQARAGYATLALFAVSHFCIDLYSSALSTYQPLLVDKLQLSLTQAGLLGGALVFSSSLLQPLYGILSDRYPSRLFTALAPAVAGIFIACLGFSSGLGWAVLCVLLGGVGIASFHPQASANATVGLPGQRGRWMAMFISAGTLGLACGPTYFASVLSRHGLSGSYQTVWPGLLMTAILLWRMPQPVRAAHHARWEWAPFQAVLQPLLIHFLLVVIRSIVQITFTQFLPLYFVRERGYSLPEASLALTLYLAAGAVGGFTGGHLADRHGGRFVVAMSMITCVPCLVTFFLTTGWVSLAALALGGLTLLFTIPVNVVMAQELVPGQAGTVSALTMGFAWGVAGLIFIPLTGWVASWSSLHAALFLLTAFPLLGFLLTLRLPK